MLLLVVIAWSLWHLRARLIGHSGGAFDYRLWASLVVLVFGGSGLIFSFASLPSRVSNVRRLAPIVAALSGPIYADQVTANDLTYLHHYGATNIRSEGSLDNQTMRILLHMRRGCIIVNEPELDQLVGDGLTVSASAYNLLWHQRAGWMSVDRFPSAENALEHVAVMCAQGRPTSTVEVRVSHGRRRAV
jgi:hypothetical protein